MMMMMGDAMWWQLDADAVGVFSSSGNGNRAGIAKSDGPESSKEQKASAAAPTKAVGVICW